MCEIIADRRSQIAGFTLIEISIVLVIIGLIVGGILVGQELIKAAELRAQISEMEKLDTAFATFKIKYNALAGDIPNASTFGLDNGCKSYGFGGTGGNGNGDGIFNYETPSGPHGIEDRKAFTHLNNAGLWPYNNGVGGSYVYSWGGFTDYGWNPGGNAVPSTASKNVYVAAVGKYNGAAASHGVSSGFYFYYSNTNNVNNVGLGHTTMDALTIDTKMDNGLPNSGKVRAFGIDGAAASAGGAGSANCINTDVATNPYNVAYTSAKTCVLAFKMNVYQ